VGHDARVTYWAVAFVSPDAGWAVGPGGRITRLAFIDLILHGRAARNELYGWVNELFGLSSKNL